MENKFTFQKLTPRNDLDIDIYKKGLDFVFKNDDLKNIAISGAYGSGKSSLIESYKNKNKEKKFIHISLAHFENVDNTKHDVKESVLEGKILNQLIHQIPSKNIPQTHFKSKKKTNWWSPILIAILFTAVFISIFHIAFFQNWSNYVGLLSDSWIKSILSISTINHSTLVSGLAVILICYYFIYLLIKAQKNHKLFRKVRVKDYEIEIFEESEESYFDKYLNEVLYLFENLDADVVVFEDLDRFNANRIFERLREINTLANIQLKKEGKQTLRFFYLIRDDIFISKDRVKFFDFIIPTVPIIDSSNSYDQLISHFTDGEIIHLFKGRFLQGLSLYIDDMRILKNIYNEFYIYYNRLNVTELDADKMLSIIAYKNLFPRDFSDLQLNKGMVYNLFHRKKEFVESEKEQINEEIALVEKELTNAKDEHLESISELVIVFKDGQHRNHFNQLTDDSKQKYEIRKTALENKLNDNITSLEDKLSNLKDKIRKLENKSLNEIITRENINQIFKITYINEIGREVDFNEIKSSDYFDLLKYLIRNGYIDETYEDYMTYFFEYSLSKIDKIFLRSISDQKAKDFDYKLKDPKAIINHLNILDFEQREVLNFDLLKFLLNAEKYEKNLLRLIKQLKHTQNYEFIIQFFDTNEANPALVNILNAQWSDFFYNVIEEEVMNEKQVKEYSLLTLLHSEDGDIKSVNIDDCLVDYISNCSDYLNIESPDIRNIIYGFKILGVSFEVIDIEKSNMDLLDRVYGHSLYEINNNNLNLMLRQFYEVDSYADLVHRNYTLIFSQSDTPLAIYVNKNIDDYMRVMLLNCKEYVDDDEKFVLEILNNEDISQEYKLLYIDYLDSVVSSIEKVGDKSLWKPLIEKKLVSYSEKNIVDYIGDSESIDDSLRIFIDSSENILDFSLIEDEEDEEKWIQIFKAILFCIQLSNEKYEELLGPFKEQIEKFNLLNIPNEKIVILINLGIIPMTLDNLLFFRENYQDNVLDFISYDFENYVDIITPETFDYDEAILILDLDISDELKLQILENTTEPITIIDKDYSAEVSQYILRNNLHTEDINHLFNGYESYEDIIKLTILDIAIDKIEDILEGEIIISLELLKDLLEAKDLDSTNKLKIFLATFKNWNQEEMKYYLGLLGYRDFNNIFDRSKRPRFIVSIEHKKILDKFKEQGIIKDYKEDAAGKFYSITRFRKNNRFRRDVPEHLL